MIRVVGKRGKGTVDEQLDEAAKGVALVRIDCTSGNPDRVMREGLSPFFLGPVETYDGMTAARLERAWQCSKVFSGLVDEAGNPTPEWFAWRDRMWADATNCDHMAIRYPFEKQNRNRTLYSYWKVDGEYRHLGYIEARKRIYLPLYARAVVKTEAYRRLCESRDAGENLLLVDFDGYNPHLPRYNFTYNDVIHCPLLKMGHGFVLAMLLEGVVKVDEEGKVTYEEGLMVDPHKTYSRDLRKLTEGQKLARNAATACVTIEEWRMLSDKERRELRAVAKRERLAAMGGRRLHGKGCRWLRSSLQLAGAANREEAAFQMVWANRLEGGSSYPVTIRWRSFVRGKSTAWEWIVGKLLHWHQMVLL